MRFQLRTLLSPSECLERLQAATYPWPSPRWQTTPLEDHLARYLKVRNQSFRVTGPYASSLLSLYGQLSTTEAATCIAGRVRPPVQGIFFFSLGLAFIVGVLSLILLPASDLSAAIKYRFTGLWVVFSAALYFHSWRITPQVARDMITFVERTCAAIPWAPGAV